MKILHLMLACFYIDNYNYQENVLPRINKEDGHDVKIITSTETFIDNMNLGYLKPQEYINEDGIPVVRLPYKNYVCHKVSKKVRSYLGLLGEIEKYEPDIIYCHGLQFKDLDIIGQYKKMHPNVKIYADSHEDEHNSARTFLSKHVLYGLLYNPIINRNLCYIEKIFCVSREVMHFMNNVCNVPLEKLFFFPLGGIINKDEEYENIRDKYRKQLNVLDNEILIVHSGKLDHNKKTVELVKAFSAVKDNSLKLVIIGQISTDIEDELNKLIEKDRRINFLGWKPASELMSFLAAADIYAQPGTQSATMQNAACACNAMMLYPYESHKYIFGEKAIYVEDEDDIKEFFLTISNNKSVVEEIKYNCFEISKDVLDYKKMIKQIY